MLAVGPSLAKAYRSALSAAVIGVCGALALMVAALVEERDGRIEAARVQAENTSRLVAGYVLQTVLKADIVLQDVQEHLRPADMRTSPGQQDPARSKELQRLLARKLATIPEASVLHVTNANGDHVYSSLPVVPRINIADRPHFVRQRDSATAGLVLSPPLIARTTGKWAFVASRRLDFEDGGFAGTINLVVSVDDLEGFLSTLDVGRHGVITVLDGDARVMARYPVAKEFMGKQLVGSAALTYLQQGIPQGIYETASPVDGVRRTYSLRPAEGIGLYVVTGISQDEYLADWRTHVLAYGLAALVLAATVLFMVATARRSLVEQERAQAALAREEEKFHTIADHTYDWEYWEGPAQEILFMSPSCERITGYAQADFLEDPDLVYRIVHGEDQPLMAAHRQDVAHQDEGVVDFRILRRDGEVRWIAHGCRAVFGRDGKFLGRRVSNRDITERKRAEAALARLNRELRAISDCNQALMRARDEPTLLAAVCRIICDEAGYRMAWVGFAEHDAARTVRPVGWGGVENGYLATANITWADTERGQGPTGTAIRTGTSCCIQDFATAPEAAPWRQGALSRGFRSSIALPLKDGNGATFGVLNIYSAEPQAFTPDEVRLLEELAGDLAFGIGVLRARADLQLAEQEVRALNQVLEQRVAERTGQLEAANRELEEFSYSVSHDLRGPLRAVAGFARILEEDYRSSLDDEGHRLLRVIQDAGMRMGLLIDGMLEYLRLGRRKLQAKPLDVGVLAAEAFAPLVPAGRQIRFEVAPLPLAQGDAALVRDVLDKLLENAIRFTAPKDDACITVGGMAGACENTYFVRDNGIGFDMQFADKLFRVFERLHAEPQFAGTGIGLAIVKRIIQRHGGRVWAEGRVDEGATFYFTLPAAKAESQA